MEFPRPGVYKSYRINLFKVYKENKCVIVMQAMSEIKREKSIHNSVFLQGSLERNILNREGLPLTPEDVRLRTKAFDITENSDLLEKARWIVAAEYSTFSEPPRDISLVYKEICLDDYDNNNRSRWIATVTTDPEGKSEISGVFRLVLGKEAGEDGLLPLEAMSKFDVHSWPHKEEGIPNSQIGEITRFAIPKKFRVKEMRNSDALVIIGDMLYGKALEVAQVRGIEALYAIMPQYVVKLSQAVGVKVVPVEGARIREDDLSARETFETYNVYWKRLTPRLYRFLSVHPTETLEFTAFSRRYKDARKESISKATEIPQVTLYGMQDEKGKREFIRALRHFPQKVELLPWNSDDLRGILTEALERGILTDRFDFQLKDLAETARPKDYFQTEGKVLKRYVDRYDRWQHGTIAEFSWKKNGRFVRILDHEPFYKVAFSRNRFIISKETQQRLRGITFAIDGLGVGTACAYLLALSGAENFVICDGGNQDLHDHNRLIGADVAEIGLNQAVRWARMAYELNPYIDITCYPKNLEPGEGEVVKIETFLDGVGILIEEADHLPTKFAARQGAKKSEVPVLMGTDLGLSGLLQVEENDTPIFQGRLTEEYALLLEDPEVDFRTKTRIATDVIVGFNNVPSSYLEVVERSQAEKAPFWPQVGIAAYLSAPLVVTAALRVLEGKEIPREARVNLEEILEKS